MFARRDHGVPFRDGAASGIATACSVSIQTWTGSILQKGQSIKLAR